jgi:hypothetical protein
MRKRGEEEVRQALFLVSFLSIVSTFQFVLWLECVLAFLLQWQQ